MRLSAFFLFLFLSQVWAGTGYSQHTKLTLKMDNARIIDVLDEIENNSEFYFLFNQKLVDVERKVDVNAKEKTIDLILTDMFAETGVKHQVKDRLIILTTEKSYFIEEPVLQQQKSVSGTVSDKDGLPLPGVTVLVKGTAQGTVTNADGNYNISNISKNATLVFSFVGMKTQEVLVVGKISVNVVMLIDAIGIEEVVAVGYGTQRKVNLTGSISTIDSDELEEISVPNLGQSIMGRTSGLFIKNVNGQPGDEGAVNINIRGFGTPLIIIDGMPASSYDFQQLTSADIEDFSVLKDAAAAAVYGARAGNGVILVTTKRGEISKPKFTYTGDLGMQFFTIMPDFVNSEQYARMENLSLFNQGKDPIWSDDQIAKFADGSDPIHYPDTDWKSMTFKDFAAQTQHNLNVRGGAKNVKYFVSFGYFHQDGMLKSDDIKLDRYNLRSNLDITLSKKLDMGIDIALNHQDYIGSRHQIERTSSAIGIMTMLNRARPYWNNEPFPDQSYTPAMADYYMGPLNLMDMEQVGYKDRGRLVGDIKLNFAYELPFGFKTWAIFQFKRVYTRDKEKFAETPLYYYNWDTEEYSLITKTNSTSKLQEKMGIAKDLNQQYFLSWDKKFSDHDFSALFVYEKLSNNYDYFNAQREDFMFDLDYLFAGSSINMRNDGFATEGGRKAYIGRINYSYKSKYLVELNSRYDGSPNFPPDTRWGFFPSASFGWRISEEGFIKDNLPYVDNLKLRASHGLLGYDRAGNFQYLATYSKWGSYIYGADGVSTGIAENALPNTSITWEKMYTTNAGLDFTLWNNKLEGSFDYFFRKRTDVLGTRKQSMPEVVGADLPKVNYAEYNNRGWELMLNHHNKIGEFTYSIGGNVSWNREKYVLIDQSEFSNEESRRRNDKIGEWTDRFWVLPTDGLFTSKEEINGWADIDGKNNATILPGDVKYIDSNGDGRITSDDKIIAGRGDYPRFTYGINSNCSWKGFEFSMLWQGAGLYNINLAKSPDLHLPFYAQNTPNTFMLGNSYIPENPWMESNTDPDVLIPLFRTDGFNRKHHSFKTSQHWLRNGAYLRLKTIQLGYNLPKRLIDRFGIDNCKLYVSGYNVLTFSALEFLDPEADTHTNRTFGDYHPPLGTYNVGINLQF